MLFPQSHQPFQRQNNYLNHPNSLTIYAINVISKNSNAGHFRKMLHNGAKLLFFASESADLCDLYKSLLQ